MQGLDDSAEKKATNVAMALVVSDKIIASISLELAWVDTSTSESESVSDPPLFARALRYWRGRPVRGDLALRG